MDKSRSRLINKAKPTKTECAAIFDKACHLVEKRYFDPNFNGKDWMSLARNAREQIIETEDAEQFEKSMHDLVCQLGTSHTGFFHESLRRVPGRLAVSATFRKHETPLGLCWMFQDVHEGGPAHTAGIRPLDILVAVDGRPITPPEQPSFPMGTVTSVRVQKYGGRESLVDCVIPKPRSRKQPYSEPRVASAYALNDEVGYLKTTIAPGLIGIDLAHELDAAIGSLNGIRRLVIDLRGYLGGGLGVLRLMSFLTPTKIPVGYTLTRRRTQSGYRKEELPRFGRIPSSKLEIPLLALRFAGRDESVTLVTEGLGPRSFHGRIVLLVTEHTVSAGEMICGFAAENRLATIVGAETAGRLLPGKGFKVGCGYLVILPEAKFLTWQGKSYEGQGVVPDVRVEWSPEKLQEGIDQQLNKAIAVSKSL
jgi:carboxyl-terminal processing protease